MFSILFVDGSKMAAKTVSRGLLGGLGSSWGGLGAVLGRSWAALGGSWALFGRLLGRLEGVLGCSWELLGPLGTVLAAHEAINGSFWVVLKCDSLIQCIDSIYGSDSSIRFVHWIEVWFYIMSSTPTTDSTTPPGGMREAIK